jgi:glycosyltransferase involved in cell wall biosynthesis
MSSEVVRPRILLVAMANSIHTARWMGIFAQSDFDIDLFPSTPSRSVHPKIEALIQGNQNLKVRIPMMMRWLAFPLGLLDVFFSNSFRSRILRKLLSDTGKRYHIVHAMELQHAGYLLSRSLDIGVPPNKVIVSNWGSDIFWFQRFSSHRKRLEKLLSQATHYSCECKRDIDLALELGFRGAVLPVHPNAGPISTTDLDLGLISPPPSQRKIILVKGYTGFVGRADLALNAIGEIADLLPNYEIIVYSSDIKSRRIAKAIAQKHGLNIKTLTKHQLGHSDMLELFRSARIYVGISESDGISTSLLDAIASGAFPIQTSSSCANEWITDARSGFLVSVSDPTQIAEKLVVALENDDLVDTAAKINFETARHRLTSDAMAEDLLNFYSG